MFLYNSKSGGQKALSLIKYFKAYTSLIYDLFELDSSDSELHKLSDDLQKYQHQIVVCVVGGDGSQNWAASIIDKAIQLKLLTLEMKHVPFPTIIPFSMGSGNDLSRSLGWGHIEKRPNKIIKYVADAHFCYNYTKRFSVLDRWSISYTFDETIGATNFVNSFHPPLPQTFLCYLSIGYDGMISYKFNMERNNNPEKFTSQKSNEIRYVKLGIKEFIKPKPSDPITECVELTVDGKLLEIPNGTRSLKVVNLNSAANGVFFFGNRSSSQNDWQKPKLNDGLIEVMATKGPKDLVLAKSNLSHAHRLGQSNDIRLKVIKTPIYLQIDGEGWKIEKKCTLHITLHDQLPTLIGYKFPRGVRQKYVHKYRARKIKKRRHRFREVFKLKHNIPRKFSKGYDPNEQITQRKYSVDDSHLGLNEKGHVKKADIELTRLHSMSDLHSLKRSERIPWYRRSLKKMKKKLSRRKKK